MSTLVYTLVFSCLTTLCFTSPYEYQSGHTSVDDIHVPQAISYGYSGNTDSDIGKLSSGIKLDSGSSLLHGSDAEYGSGFGYSASSDGVYSGKPSNSEDLSLPALDLTKHSVSSLQTLSHGSELLTGLAANSDAHGTLNSLTTLHHAPSGIVYNDKELSSTDNEDYIKNLLLSSVSATSGSVKTDQILYGTLDSHTTSANDLSSGHLTGNSHSTEEHSYLSSIIKAFSHGWSALFSH